MKRDIPSLRPWLRRAAVALALVLPAASAADAQPPLLDRELFFGNPEIAAAQLSPDGKYVAFLRPWKDTRNVWVKKTEEPYAAARLLTTEAKRPIPAFFWTSDGRSVLFIKDKDGDENFNVYAVDPAATPPAGQEAPAARNISDAKGVRAQVYALPKSDPDVIYIGLNDRDAAWHDVYKVKISTGERTLVRQNTDRIAGWVFDLHGGLRLATRTADNGDTEACAWTPPVSPTCTPAASSRPATRTGSTRTASASTCRRTRARPTSSASSSSTPPAARRRWSSPIP